MGLKSILITLLLGVPCFGQVPSIEGPSAVEPGQFILLQASSLDGFWLPDPELSGEYIQCSDRLGTSILTPGRYWFQYAVVDESGLLVAQHLVVVGKVSEPVPDPVPDQPGENLQWQAIKEVSANGARLLNDPITAAKLVKAIRSAKPGDSLVESSKIITVRIDNALATRQGESRFRDWLNLWRVPVNEAISAAEIITTDQYLEALNAAAAGLRQSIQQTQAGERN